MVVYVVEGELFFPPRMRGGKSRFVVHENSIFII